MLQTSGSKNRSQQLLGWEISLYISFAMLNLWPPPPMLWLVFLSHVHGACPCCLSLLHVNETCRISMHVHAPWTYMPMPHVFAAWLYMPMPHVFAEYPLLFKTFCSISDLQLQDWTVYCNNKLCKLLSNCNYWLFGLLHSNSSLLRGIQQTETRLIVADKGNKGQPACPRKWMRCERKNMNSNASVMYICVPCIV